MPQAGRTWDAPTLKRKLPKAGRWPAAWAHPTARMPLQNEDIRRSGF